MLVIVLPNYQRYLYDIVIIFAFFCWLIDFGHKINEQSRYYVNTIRSNTVFYSPSEGKSDVCVAKLLAGLSKSIFIMILQQ